MTHNERAAAERLRAWLGNDHLELSASNTHDLRTVLDAPDRHERLAGEGLTEGDNDALRWYMDNEDRFRDTAFDAEVRAAIVKLQAQLAELKTFRDIFIGNGWGDDVLAQTVEHETAKECAKLARETGHLGTPMDVESAIRRRFNLAAPQADQQQDAETERCETDVDIYRCRHCNGGGGTSCRRCGGHDHINCRLTEGQRCRACHGTGRVTPAQAERRDRHIEERTP